MKAWISRWFAVAWPDRFFRQQVAAEYAAIGAKALADIAMRNFLYEPAPSNDPDEIMIIEGRRRAAREIFDLARINPADLADIQVRLPQGADHAG
ncbi:MAG TPA: hypothetical protein VE993_01585 [Stellaceae bacterium]|nr:hypothetical protein [Roseiarcus sp.]HZU87925.1 hypothetical protein [Stellaceae bacterium]